MLILASFESFTLTSWKCQYINLLIDEYGLRTTLKKKSIIDFDDLYLLLYTHWVFDDSTFKNERQRVQVVIDLLTIAFFDCRSYSLFDIRVKLDEPSSLDVLIDDTEVASAQEDKKVMKYIKIDEGNHVKSNCDGDTIMSIDATCHVDGNFNTIQDSDSDSDNDSSSLYNCDENSNIDDNCDAKSKETWSFLYRHFIISIVVNQTFGKFNLVFMKTTLLHIKGEDNNSRM